MNVIDYDEMVKRRAHGRRYSYGEPMNFPNLRDRPRIAIDLETHDPQLKSKGPGVRRDGYPVGYAVAWEDGEDYYPTRHKEGANYPEQAVESWLRDELKEFKGEVVFANGLYDLDYMAERGIHVNPKAKIRDIQIAEPLLDDNRIRYSLESLAQQYLGRGKTEKYLIDLYGKDFKMKMESISSDLAGDYAKDDARETFDVFSLQVPKLHDQRLWGLFEMESDLTPMLLYMRRLGVPIDVAATDALSNDFYLRQAELEKQLEKETGVPFYSDKTTSVWKPTALAAAFDKAGIPYPRTPITQAPSFRKQWLENHKSKLAQQILAIRSFDKLRGTFLQSSLLGNHIDGRIHTTFNQVKNDQGGAVTGRFSSKNPNLQQIPSRDDDLAPLIRALFIPEDGHSWFCYDWSQIEYRLLVHYAIKDKASGSRRMLRQYLDDPETDYHIFVQELVKEKLGRTISRKPIKNINFGLIYGMGLSKLGAMLGMAGEELEEFLTAYHKAIPFATEMKDNATAVARRRGFIRTILGRRRRFDLWESRDWDTSKEDGALPLNAAIKRYGGRHAIRRAGTYKALNALIQGSAADLMKMAMLKVWKAGLTSGTGGPLHVHLTVHDELDGSVPDTAEGREALQELKYIMEHAIKLEVPILADGGIGKNWAEAK